MAEGEGGARGGCQGVDLLSLSLSIICSGPRGCWAGYGKTLLSALPPAGRIINELREPTQSHGDGGSEWRSREGDDGVYRRAPLAVEPRSASAVNPPCPSRSRLGLQRTGGCRGCTCNHGYSTPVTCKSFGS